MTTTVTASGRIPVKLDITSDSICPFCYVGYKRITKAIKMAKEQDLPLDFEIQFHPFELDSTLPVSPGENKRERYQRRFGGAEKVAAMEQSMIERGKAEGINFSYGGNVSNTLDSHRLLTKSRELKGEEGQLKLVEAFFNSYFEEEKDIGSFDVLAADAEKAGVMTKDEALAFLKSNEGKSSLKTEIRKAQVMGISGVPFTVLNERLAISGAQETETFFDVFKRVASGELKA